jgi:transposase
MLKNENKSHHSHEFRVRAVALAEEVGATRASKMLGIHRVTLYNWSAKLRNGGPLKKDDTPEKKAMQLANKEIHKLKKQVEDLKKANYVLKELASVFSKDSLSKNLRRSLNFAKKPS